MKVNEFKDKIVGKLNELIDVYYGEDNIVDNITNTTLKIIVNVNQDKLNDMLYAFSKDGDEIDAETIISAYVGNIPSNGFLLDIKQFIKNPIINSILPNKSLSISKEDIQDIIKTKTNG